MTKRITIADGAIGKASTREMLRLTDEVKSKTGEVGSEGILKGNIFYRIVRGGFIIF